jgi:DNA repair photolyase
MHANSSFLGATPDEWAAASATPRAVKGRGTAWAIEHRFSRERHEPFDDGWGAQMAESPRDAQAGTRLATEVSEEQVRSLLAANPSPDVGFDLSINPYRGCEHGCIYCYARPTHGWLNLSPGVDFETRIVAKVNAAQVLRRELAAPGYVPRPLNIGSVTDAYQPVERRLGITRGVLEVLAEHRHAFSVITKSSGIERDLDLIAPMAADRLAAAYVSVTTLDSRLARTLEPRAAAPARRLLTIERLARAGVPVGVSVSPLIPFLNEPELERILQAACDAGARRAFSIPIRLPWEVAPLFEQWLQQHHPQRAARVLARIRDMRSGRLNDPDFGTRMSGTGVWAELRSQRLARACRQLGLGQESFELDLSLFRRPEVPALHAPRGAAHTEDRQTSVQRELF